jgi:hypothetical protein
MAGLLESLLGKVGATVLMAAFKSIRARLQPRRLSRPSAPRNFFEHFGPGVPQELVRELLGSPHRQSEGYWGYAFNDALAQFEFNDAGRIESVALALTESSPKAGFPIPMLGVPLGKLHLDYFASDTDGKFWFRESSRTWELLYQSQLLPSITRSYHTFGALAALTPGELSESLFNVATARSSPRIASKGVRVNWVAISSSAEEMWFDWTLALPLAA